MSDYITRVANSAVAPRTGEHVLDWHPGSQKATIQIGESGQDFLAGWRPPRPAADLLLLGASVYCVDKTASRRASPDAWTRDLHLRLPVAAPEAFIAADWPRTLAFLTGDTWQLEPYASELDPLDGIDGLPESTTSGTVTAVSSRAFGAMSADPPRADHMRLGIVEKDHVTLFLYNAGDEVIATASMSIDISERLVIDIMAHVEKLQLSAPKKVILQ